MFNRVIMLVLEEKRGTEHSSRHRKQDGDDNVATREQLFPGLPQNCTVLRPLSSTTNSRQ